jgi:hypothetical protein
VAVRLDHRDYPTALEAHGRGRTVHVRGRAKRMKTQYSITTLLIFEDVGNHPPEFTL